MKIAATYDNGNIFGHFGRTEFFKVYTVEDGKVVSSEVIGSDGQGHGALAGVLAGHAIDVLICGGIGGGAQNALADAGIAVVSGAEGSADEAVAMYLRGELASAGTNCDHHDHEEGHSCSGGCGGGCGGCHAPAMEGRNVGKVCRVHYCGTLDDGSQFDSSYDRGEPLEFTCGAGQMIRGFDMAVADMEVGAVVDVHLEPKDAYGEPSPAAIFSFEIAALPGSEELEVSQRVYLYDQMGRPIAVKVIAKDDVNITFDANHELAGQALNFRIELVEVK